METRARVLGQAVNPVLMLLPLGILVTATIADLGGLLSGLSLFASVARVDMVPGLLAGAVALCALLVDLVTAPTGSPARAALGVISVAFGSMIALFTLVWSVRGNGGGNALLFVVELIALGGGVVAAKLARDVTLGRGLHRFGGRADEDAAEFTRTAVARRMAAARAAYDPDDTVVIFGLGSSRSRPHTS